METVSGSQIDYALAKELADANFPKLILFFSDRPGETPMVANPPTLSELITECKSLNHDFTFTLEGTRHGPWIASLWDFGKTVKRRESDTPEEAVARLWLAFKKADRASDTSAA